jgi:hypothetical protein
MAHQQFTEKDVGFVEHIEKVDSKITADVTEVERLTGAQILPYEDDNNYIVPPTTARDIVTEILAVEDDPSQNPWTFRMWFIGIGISIFAS